jgi:hypothetical protein
VTRELDMGPSDNTFEMAIRLGERREERYKIEDYVTKAIS